MIGLHAIHGLSQSRTKAFSKILKTLDAEYPRLRTVLVTKVSSPKHLAAMLSATGIREVQLHRPFDIPRLQALVSEIEERAGFKPKIIPVLAAGDPGAVSYASELKEIEHLFELFLIDSGWRGGTGEVAQFDVVSRIFEVLPPARFLIAGGITVNNAAAVIRDFRPAGIDIQSGTERPEYGHTKDPELIFQLSELVKGKPIKREDLGATRRLVSVSLTEVKDDQVSFEIKRFQKTDIDLVHIDHSDGSMTRSFVAERMIVAEKLHKFAPCLPYDLHIFLNDGNRAGTIVNEYLQANPLIRVVFFQLEDVSDAYDGRLYNFWKRVSHTPVSLGLALHGTRMDVNGAKAILSLTADLPVKEISVVTHSNQHPLDAVTKSDKPLVQAILAHALESKHNPRVSVDRDMNVEKLRVFVSDAPSHVIVGKGLLQSKRPQVMITRMRALLSAPRTKGFYYYTSA